MPPLVGSALIWLILGQTKNLNNKNYGGAYKQADPAFFAQTPFLLIRKFSNPIGLKGQYETKCQKKYGYCDIHAHDFFSLKSFTI
jgi:hypothetical protein